MFIFRGLSYQEAQPVIPGEIAAHKQRHLPTLAITEQTSSGNPNLHLPRSKITRRLSLAVQQDHPHSRLVWNRALATARHAFVLVACLSPRDRNLVFHPWTTHSKQTELEKLCHPRQLRISPVSTGGCRENLPRSQRARSEWGHSHCLLPPESPGTTQPWLKERKSPILTKGILKYRARTYPNNRPPASRWTWWSGASSCFNCAVFA